MFKKKKKTKIYFLPILLKIMLLDLKQQNLVFEESMTSRKWKWILVNKKASQLKAKQK